MSDAPPRATESPRDMSDPRYPRYADTPMPDNTVVPDDISEGEDNAQQSPTLLTQAMTMAIVAMLLAHLWSLWTLRTDINIIMSYQREHVQQYQHIAHLLQNMHQVKWQMVPSS